jgi:hypothetical protein
MVKRCGEHESRLIDHEREAEADFGPAVRAALNKKLAAHLIREDGEDFQPKTAAFAGMELCRQADPVIPNGEFTTFLGVAEDGDDLALAAMGKGVLEAVGERLIEGERQWHEPFW